MLDLLRIVHHKTPSFVGNMLQHYNAHSRFDATYFGPNCCRWEFAWLLVGSSCAHTGPGGNRIFSNMSAPLRPLSLNDSTSMFLMAGLWNKGKFAICLNHRTVHPPRFCLIDQQLPPGTGHFLQATEDTLCMKIMDGLANHCRSCFFQQIQIAIASMPYLMVLFPWDPGDLAVVTEGVWTLQQFPHSRTPKCFWIYFAVQQTLQQTLDLGEPVLDWAQFDVQMPWDPGGSTWSRLEGKPDFYEGGIVSDLPPVGCCWAMGLPGNYHTQPLQVGRRWTRERRLGPDGGFGR